MCRSDASCGVTVTGDVWERVCEAYTVPRVAAEEQAMGAAGFYTQVRTEGVQERCDL